jgi:hypothetical protein
VKQRIACTLALASIDAMARGSHYAYPTRAPTFLGVVQSVLGILIVWGMWKLFSYLVEKIANILGKFNGR